MCILLTRDDECVQATVAPIAINPEKITRL